MSESNGTTSTQPTDKTERKLKIFISYSRSDSASADALVEALERRNFEVIIDRRSLPALEDWERELLGFIRAADTVVFIVSPASLRSPVCQWEVDQVKAHGKRLAPVSLIPAAELSRYAIPSEIARINMIFFTEPAHPGEMLDRLVTALRTDRQWWLEHTRLVGLAMRWHEGGRKDHDLLRSEAIGAATGWSQSRPANAAKPTEIFDAYHERSRQFEEQENRRQRRIIGRAFVKPADEALRNEEYEHAIRLAAAGAILAKDIDMKMVPELWHPLAKAIAGNRTHSVLRGHNGIVSDAKFSPDGTRILTASYDGTARIWDAATATVIAILNGHTREVVTASFSPDGKWVLTGSSDGTARIWDTLTGAETVNLKGHTREIVTASFSSDGEFVVTASIDSTIRIWKVKAGTEVAVLKSPSPLNTASFSPDAFPAVTLPSLR